MITVNVVAIIVIILWAFWCLLSAREDDGLFAKIIYLAVMLAALGVLSAPVHDDSVKFNCAIAAIGVRRFWLAVCWPPISRLFRRHNKPE